MSKARDLADFQGSASALTTGTLPVDRVPYVGRRNLIINGGFDVWQRGTSFTGSTFVADRWQVNGGASSGGSFSVSQQAFSAQELGDSTPTYYLRFTSTGASGGWVGPQVFQKIERNSRRLFDKATTYTVSFYAKSSDVATMQVRIQRGAQATFSNEDCTLTNSWQKFERTVALSTDDNSSRNYDELGLSMGVGLNGTVDIANVQLELGSVATPFEHRSYGEELALCQRYFHALVQGGSPYDGYTHVGHAGVNSSTNVTVHVDMPVEMRTYPSISAKSGTTFYLGNNGGGWVWNEAYGWNKNGGRLSFGHPSSQSISIYQTRDFYFEGNSGTNTHALYFDAEL